MAYNPKEPRDKIGRWTREDIKNSLKKRVAFFDPENKTRGIKEVEKLNPPKGQFRSKMEILKEKVATNLAQKINPKSLSEIEVYNKNLPKDVRSAAKLMLKHNTLKAGNYAVNKDKNGQIISIAHYTKNKSGEASVSIGSLPGLREIENQKALADVIGKVAHQAMHEKANNLIINVNDNKKIQIPGDKLGIYLQKRGYQDKEINAKPSVEKSERKEARLDKKQVNNLEKPEREDRQTVFSTSKREELKKIMQEKKKADIPTKSNKQSAPAISKTENKNLPKKEPQEAKEKESPISENPHTTIHNQKDFEDVFLTKMHELSKAHNSIPIFKIRRAIGEAVPRDKFTNYLMEMQSKGLVQPYGGSLDSNNQDELQDSLHTKQSGLRTYIRRGDELSKEKLEKLANSSKEKTDNLLKNRKELNQFGTASGLAKGNKISSQKEFNSVVEEAVHRMNHEFSHSGMTPIAKIRELLKERVPGKEFDEKFSNMLDSDRDDIIIGNSKTIGDNGGYEGTLGNKNYIAFGDGSRRDSDEQKKLLSKFNNKKTYKNS